MMSNPRKHKNLVKDKISETTKNIFNEILAMSKRCTKNREKLVNTGKRINRNQKMNQKTTKMHYRVGIENAC